MRLAGEHIAEHFGKGLECPVRESGSCAGTEVRSLSLNVIYTSPEPTISARRAVESSARDLSATGHIRAMITVPRQLATEFAFTSLQIFRRLISDLIKRVGSSRFEYVLHMYVCRSRIDTLLKVLRPSSLLVIGGRRRFWPTTESRISKAAISAGHSVTFVEAKGF